MNRALEIAEIFERISLHGGMESKIIDCWRDELKINYDTLEFKIALACIEQKFDILIEDIEFSNINDRAKNLYEQAIRQLKKFADYGLAFNLKKSQLLNHKNQIDIIFLAADNLPSYLVPEINPLTIDAIRSEIRSLMEIVRESDIEKPFKFMLLNSLSAMLLSVEAYKTLGPDGAAKLYGTAAAEIARLSGTPHAKKPEAQGLAKKALTLCKKTGAAIIFAGAVVGGAHSVIEDGSSILGIDSNSTQTEPKRESE